MDATINKFYICPGETHPITRAVHLARLAAFYPKCRDCALRNDTGHLPRQTVVRLQKTERRAPRKSLLTREGFRGAYLNEITRRLAEQVAGALAGCLWERRPLTAGGRSSPGSRTEICAAVIAQPLIVVGHDERPASPDLVTGVVRALRRMSCRVVDIGLTTRPCFWFAAHHLQAAGGMFVTGAGCDASWTGFDLLGTHACPLSRATSTSDRPSLDDVEQRLGQPLYRPTRRAGPYRLFQADVPYEASLWKQFHALRPLQVVCGTSSPLVRRRIENIFAKLPCRLQAVVLPVRSRRELACDDPDLVRIGECVRSTNAHLGILVDDDGQRTVLLDESGATVSPEIVSLLIGRLLLAEHPQAAVVVETANEAFLATECREASDASRTIPSRLADALEAAGGRVAKTCPTLAGMADTMRRHAAVFGCRGDGRWWFQEGFPTCDAILTLARTLDVLSRSDAPFSALTGSHAGSQQV